MNYSIADIRIALPDDLTAGAFAEALAPFADGEGEGPETPESPYIPSGRKDPNSPERRAAPTDTCDLVLEQGRCLAPQADFRELDRFDFSDANADCRFGHDAAGYLLEMIPRDGSAPARFRKPYDRPPTTTDFTPAHHPALLRFGLWTAFNLAALHRAATAFHASVIAFEGRGVLFLGESGTGKSTHTRLWREHIPGATLLNDDSPIVRVMQGGIRQTGGSCGWNNGNGADGKMSVAEGIGGSQDGPRAADGKVPDAYGGRRAIEEAGGIVDGIGTVDSWVPGAGGIGYADGSIRVFGSPWSGKTACYRSESLPVAAIVRLSQAPRNRIRRLGPLEAIGALQPSVPPAFARDERLQDALCEILSHVVTATPVYHLECLPEAGAARLCRETIFGV